MEAVEPDELKALAPFLTNQDAKRFRDMEFNTIELENAGVMVPPFHPYCYADGTRVFTERGLIGFAEVAVETDLFLSLNPETRRLEWVKAQQKLAYPYKGKMLRVSATRKKASTCWLHRTTPYFLTAASIEALQVGCGKHGSDLCRKSKNTKTDYMSRPGRRRGAQIKSADSTPPKSVSRLRQSPAIPCISTSPSGVGWIPNPPRFSLESRFLCRGLPPVGSRSSMLLISMNLIQLSASL